MMATLHVEATFVGAVAEKVAANTKTKYTSDEQTYL